MGEKPMSCAEAEKLFRLSIAIGEERPELQEHLSHCPSCRTAAERERSFARWLAARLAEALLAERVVKTIENLPDSGTGAPPILIRRKYQLVAAALLIAAIPGVLWILDHREPPPLAERIWGVVTIDGGWIRTPAGQGGGVRLDEHTLAELSLGAELHVEKTASGCSARMTRGFAKFKVAYSGRFVVRTPVADVAMSGTELVAKFSGEESMPILTVIVLSGMAHVSNAKGRLTLQAGETASAAGGQAPTLKIAPTAGQGQDEQARLEQASKKVTEWVNERFANQEYDIEGPERHTEELLDKWMPGQYIFGVTASRKNVEGPPPSRFILLVSRDKLIVSKVEDWEGVRTLVKKVSSKEEARSVAELLTRFISAGACLCERRYRQYTVTEMEVEEAGGAFVVKGKAKHSKGFAHQYEFRVDFDASGAIQKLTHSEHDKHGHM
jgi:ferric-dicitrate binding protein FerR (iron transport regulator)